MNKIPGKSGNFVLSENVRTPGYLLMIHQGFHSEWKTWTNGKAVSSQGKAREFGTDWKSPGKSHKILENSANLR